MPDKQRHELQAQHNQRVLATLPQDAPDWKVTLMMYVALHGCRAYISSQRQGYAGHDVNYPSIQRILQHELDSPQLSLAANFNSLVKNSYKSRYHCLPKNEMDKLLLGATRTYDAILSELRQLGITLN